MESNLEKVFYGTELDHDYIVEKMVLVWRNHWLTWEKNSSVEIWDA
jgi:hypothetical protein